MFLVLNSGSSSLKFKLFDMNKNKSLEAGIVDGIGLETCAFEIDEKREAKKIKNHAEAIKIVLKHIPIDKIDVVGHRVVHGGEFYSVATVINSNVIKKIDALSELAPLHNPPNLQGILACKEVMPKVKQVAVFDTAFHETIPEEAYMYAIPYEYYKKYKVRKYGFHGTSHKYVMLEAQKILKKKRVNLITCHLGNGSSVTAIRGSESVDTSMGFTPLQGLIMGTRSGDIDAGCVEFLSEKEGLSVGEVLKILNKKSGLLGICGLSDVRSIHEKAEKGDRKAKLALDMLSYRIIEYIGSYFAVLGRVDAIVFTAGIGEGAWYIRERVCKALDGLGVEIDKRKNRKGEVIVSNGKSKIKVMIIPTNEELMIAKECYDLLKK